SVGVEDGGELIATGYLRRRGDYAIADFFVRPDARGRGAATALLDWGERVSVELGLTALRTGFSARDADGIRLLESRGYHYIRSFYRMAIDLDEQPPAPSWPP